MTPEEILVAVEEVLELARGGRPEDASMRESLVAERYPSFVEDYPKLTCMCCEATTPDKADLIRRFLPLMLEQMRSMDDGAATFEVASKVVGQALGDHYVPPPPPEAADGGAPQNIDS